MQNEALMWLQHLMEFQIYLPYLSVRIPIENLSVRILLVRYTPLTTISRRMEHYPSGPIVAVVVPTYQPYKFGLCHVVSFCCASVLTDLVFWLVLYPFVTPKDFRLDIFTVGMHSVNAVLLLGETSLNCMSFPVFRFAYFILWTVTFVIFQWIIHAAVSLW
ncbi:hypothetical protein L195_g011927 [Trifolium pratense]|uniref:Uncharacterized protein n=1 Tax=Trifolium pratense TaxID=57577 RepID=A0A2K3PIY7_TRIPR|nr:hypothetical protein L195_g011927 [Trifolium pratense]